MTVAINQIGRNFRIFYQEEEKPEVLQQFKN